MWDFRIVWNVGIRGLGPAGPAEAVAIIERALDKAAKETGGIPVPLGLFARERIHQELGALIPEAEAAFPGLKARLVDLAVRLPPPIPVAIPYVSLEMRTAYTQRHLEDFLSEVRAQAKAAGTLSKVQAEVLAKAEARSPELLRVGRKAGMPGGRSPGELAAEKVNRALYDGWRGFEATFFTDALRRAGLRPEKDFWTGGVDPDTAFYPTYTRAQLLEIQAFLKEIDDSGNGFTYDQKRRPLTPIERQIVRAQLVVLEEVLRGFPKD